MLIFSFDFADQALELRNQSSGVLDLALPNDDNSPAQRAKMAALPRIAPPIGNDLLSPVVHTALRHLIVLARMSVPEAAMYEYHCVSSRKYDVR